MTAAPRELTLDEKRAQLEAIRRNYPHFCWQPNPPQFKFLKLVEQGCREGKFIFLALFANGAGKTAFWPNLLWGLCGPDGHRLPWFDFAPFNNWPYAKRGRIICNSKQLREETGRIWRAMHECWPKAHYTEKKQDYAYPSAWRIPETGWQIDAMTESQDLLDHESEEISILIVDEPCSQEVWSVYYSRRRRGGLMFMFATLLEQGAWVEAELMNDPDCLYMHATDHENCKTCSRISLPDGQVLTGYLDHDTINKNSSHYLAHEKETRTTGRPAHYYGRVFHVSDEHYIPRTDAVKLWEDGLLTTYLSLDPHTLRPWCIVVGGIDEEGNWIILDEWPRENYFHMDSCDRGLAEYARIIKELSDRWNVSQKIIDRKFASQQMRFQSTARTMSQELLCEYGLYFATGVTDPLGEGGGVRRLQQLMELQDGKPKFRLCDDLDNCRVSVRSVAKKRVYDEKGRPCDKLDPKYLDPVRCIMYLVTHNAVHDPRSTGNEQAASRAKAIADDLAALGLPSDAVDNTSVSMI